MSAAAPQLTVPAPASGASTLRALTGVLVVALLLAGAIGWARSTHWPISVVRIDGELARTGAEPVERIVSRHTADAGFFRLDLDALQSDLAALPWLRSASLRRIWPDTLHVVIDEHTAAARWNDAALVSDEGTVFRPPELPQTELPVLAGPEGQGGEMLQRLRQLDRRLRPLDLAVQGLHQDERRAWRIELDNGIVLRLGRGDVEARLDRFMAVWPAVLVRQSARIEAVDLRYPNGFAVAWRKGAGESGNAREGGA